MDYGEVLTRAWQIIWKHKILWLFGILAGFTSSNWWSSSSSVSWQADVSYEVERSIAQIPDWQWVLIAGGFLLLILLFIVVLVFLGTIGKIGLVRGTMQADGGQDKITFGELFSGSVPYFWRVFLLNLLVGIVIFLVMFTLIIIAIFTSIITLGIALICWIPMMCLLIPVALAIDLLLEQSSIAIVVEDLGVMDGLRRGWQVVKENVGPMVIMWLILELGVNLILGMIIFLPLMFTFWPIIVGLFTGEEAAIFGGFAVAAICCAIYMPFLLVLGGIIRSYVGSAWTLTFMRLTAPLTPLEGELVEPGPVEPELPDPDPPAAEPLEA
jgi:hypothetical protein